MQIRSDDVDVIPIFNNNSYVDRNTTTLYRVKAVPMPTQCVYILTSDALNTLSHIHTHDIQANEDRLLSLWILPLVLHAIIRIQRHVLWLCMLIWMNVGWVEVHAVNSLHERTSYIYPFENQYRRLFVEESSECDNILLCFVHWCDIQVKEQHVF